MPQDEGRTSLDTFNSKASLLYLVSMTTFWILTVGAGGSTSHTLFLHAKRPPEVSGCGMRAPTSSVGPPH